MKIIRIIIHALALLTGIAAIIHIPFIKDAEYMIPYLLFAYLIVVLIFSVTLEIILASFPRQIGLLIVISGMAYQYFSGNYLFYNKIQIENFVIFTSVILSFILLIFAFIGISAGFNFRKTEVVAYKKYFTTEIIASLLLLIIFSLLVFFSEKGITSKLQHRISAILLVLFPFFNKSFVRTIVHRLQKNKNYLSLGVNFGQLGKLARIKNFVFTKDRIVSSGIYQLTESDYRSSIRVLTAIQLARELANQWNPRYSGLFVIDEFENSKLKYQVVEKNDNGISIIDDDACMYHLGNNTFIKDKIKKDDHTNLYLLKNDILLAKFRINEKFTEERIEFINQLDYFGNTILFSPGLVEDLGQDYSIIFDKIYANVNEYKQNELLGDLEKKAPTAFFTAKIPQEFPNSICFHVTTSSDAVNKPNTIIINSQKLLKIPVMIRLAKKVHSLFNKTLIFSIITQLALFLIAFFNFQSLILLFGIGATMTFIAEITAYIVFRQIGHSTSQSVE